EDVDGDGTLDLDGDYDLDIVVHEFHHGVTHRLNTAFTGAEAGAMGEGGGDFFAYSVHNDPFLAEFARPGGLRSINSKTYADWFCFLGIICSVHSNGEIFANVLWDLRERFRGDNVRGSEQAAINELHQLYIDALKLSPPTPTMLDLRDAILLADQVRNPGSPTSQNFCRIWEPFAGRGMGLHATDTEDNGLFQVGPDTSVPDGCQGPPPPPTVTLTVSAATATEAGPTSGRFTISRSAAQSSSLLVSFTLGGTALNGTDYVAIPTTVTIPSGAASATVEITPIDDTLLESNETVVMSLRAGSGYAIGSPSSGTVTIVSDDLAPDFVVSGLTAPLIGGAGLTLDVSDTTANQGTGAGEASVTSFYLSLDVFLDAADPSIGSRSVPALGAGASNTASTTLAIPDDVTSGIYRIFARADGPAQLTELNEGNNLRSVSVRIGPDLTVSALSAPAAVGAGGSFVVTDTTANTGGGGAGSSQTRYYLSANSLLDAADPAIGSRGVGTLAPGATHSGTATLTVPAGTETGLYYLFAKADGGDVVTEAIENNNTRLAWISVGPDLTISTITGPTRAAAGGTITVTDNTRNSGAGNAGASTTAFYLSSNYLLDSGDIRLGATRSVPALAAGASSMGNTTVTLPNVTAGLWYLLAAADDLGGIAETSEVNNTRYYFVSIGPDLQVASLVAPSSVAAGSTMTITDTIRNIGLNVAGASVTRFYLSLNTVVDASDTFLGERAVGSIGVGATNTGSASVVVPAGLSGLYYLLAVADGANVVAESSETNNNGLRAISVNPQ
ncbi:MAG TPA: CARDB domain-containing protein, partial [Vicinamibacterales bacterium]|nr:CARDB domain-containing protein [Vicinamibacterales bacterium]